ncbi:hypothetical protein [Sphingomonas hengshuiensis]|uniref:hypothetical protein n=1 Tax=Sphingomonas hengshuiensis TaxID=1609977 RepID=UPI000A97C72E|nr:hypothetical protein [Sphingomonas hengshuiensis]
MTLACLCSTLLLTGTPLPGGTAPVLAAVEAAPPLSVRDADSDAPSASDAQSALKPRPRIEWRNGVPVLVSADGGTSFRLLGQLIVDAASTSGAGDRSRNRQDSDVRAAHLGFAGTVANTLVYQVETEFASGSADVLWAHVGWRGKIGASLPTCWRATSRTIAASRAVRAARRCPLSRPISSRARLRPIAAVSVSGRRRG